MSNHYSAANLTFPGDDARLDFTDLYVFQAPGDTGKTTLLMNVNPYTTGISAMPPFLMKTEFHPDGIYRINVDNNGDAHKFTGKYEHRVIGGGVGHNLPQEAPQAFAQAVIDVAGF